MLQIAIDGACHRNGKPDCVAAGGVYVRRFATGQLINTKVLSKAEKCSTNQRGELLALHGALMYVNALQEEAIIITDSEYLYNTMVKEWFRGWESNGWLTAAGEPVKNSDLWKQIKAEYDTCPVDIIFYHIKGHCISLGKVTTKKLLEKDPEAYELLQAAYKKYDEGVKPDKLKAAKELSLHNNGFVLDTKTLRDFIVLNTVVDAVASKTVEETDS